VIQDATIWTSRAPPAHGYDPTLCIRLFGSMSASLGHRAQDLPLTLSPRSAELLAFLALGQARFFGRSEIADAIWDANDEVAAGSINTALWRLRRSIEQAPARPGDFLVVNRQGQVGLNGPMSLDCDVKRFEQLVLPLRTVAPEDLSESQYLELCTAINLYRDCALSEFRSPWAIRERERLRNIYLDTLYKLMEQRALKQDYPDAIHHARLLLATDGLREDVHRALMNYLVLDGQRANALRQFEICRAALKLELAIQPMRATIAVYQKISGEAVTAVEPEARGRNP
jgi:DNA-binding SARP family transcriptional activator